MPRLNTAPDDGLLREAVSKALRNDLDNIGPVADARKGMDSRGWLQAENYGNATEETRCARGTTSFHLRDETAGGSSSCAAATWPLAACANLTKRSEVGFEDTRRKALLDCHP
jgi:hypothetical protein